MQRTDSRGLFERKASVQLRLSELRKAVADCERTEAEIDTQIEQASFERERASGATHAAE